MKDNKYLKRNFKFCLVHFATCEIQSQIEQLFNIKTDETFLSEGYLLVVKGKPFPKRIATFRVNVLKYIRAVR